jgi:hypothetical protein
MLKQLAFPSVGDIIRFRGVPSMYYPMFTSMKKLAEDNLQVGQMCTVRNVHVHSSWCAVWLEEIPGDDNYLNLSFFGNSK